MANIIKIKRGLKANLPASSVATTGELRYTLDTNELFIDNGTENKLIINSNSKVDKSSVPYQIYGTDSEGNQTTYDKESFGKVDDVLIGTQSIVVDKIATLGTMASEDASEYSKTSQLANVALSGDYYDLHNLPEIPEQLQSNWLQNDTTRPDYILNKPTIPDPQINSDWNAVSGVAQILNKPDLAKVATSGDYTDLFNTPDLAEVALSGDYNDLSNRPNLATVALSGNYNDLSDTPNLAEVALSGDYTDLSNTPDLATVALSGDYTDLLNKPDLAEVATSGKYGDLLEKPNLATVALSGNYNDLLNKPFIPTTKADIGLGNVDNTSDLDKPISDATQAALDQKADKSELDDKVNIIDLVKDVQNISSAQIYTSINDLPILDASKNGTRYVALTDGELPLVIYSWDNPTQTWEKIDTIRGSSLYIDIQTSILYYYRSSIPYLREVGIHNWGKIIGNIENQTDLMNLLNTKQNNLTMGTNMEITNNTISTTATQIIRRRW